eukprot:gnl/Dysnectes_brevis/1934_a2221_1061.p1 GENE.gnl/Dysnectes_brevis/1934_a2221_1061~~gnl/Dysnectes_brevis/1934_a2221_1061.p1  ORF type:complete len:351 (+),score=90.93 gnl/Dysnectes_brevis/1934_a2221_1061:3-1055(+)
MGLEPFLRTPSQSKQNPNLFPFVMISTVCVYDSTEEGQTTVKKGSNPIPGALEALELCRKAKIPFLIASNTTGLEDKLAAKTTRTLSLSPPLPEDHFICASTPLSEMLTEEERQQPILCIGNPELALPIARAHGLTCAVSPLQVAMRWPHTCPQGGATITPDMVPDPIVPTHHRDFPTRVHTVLLAADSHRWYQDTQVAVDALTRGGLIGPAGEKGDTPRFIVLNPDLNYAAVHPAPRLTLGGLSQCIKHIAEQTSGEELTLEACGKPHAPMYRLAMKRLSLPAEDVFFFGDSPTSDMAGANAAGMESVLVLTGKVPSRAAAAALPGPQQPKRVYDDVLTAVRAILEDMG